MGCLAGRHVHLEISFSDTVGKVVRALGSSSERLSWHHVPGSVLFERARTYGLRRVQLWTGAVLECGTRKGIKNKPALCFNTQLSLVSCFLQFHPCSFCVWRHCLLTFQWLVVATLHTSARHRCPLHIQGLCIWGTWWGVNIGWRWMELSWCTQGSDSKNYDSLSHRKYLYLKEQ